MLPVSMIFTIPFLIYHADFYQLLPVLNHSYKEYIEAALNTSFAYSGFEISILAYSYVNKKEKILKTGVNSIIITGSIYLYTVVTALVIFGPGLVQKFTFPTIRILTTHEIPVLERVEFIFIILWISLAFRPISNQYYFSVHLTQKLLNMKSNKILIIIMLPIITTIAIIPDNIFDVFKQSDYIGWMSLFVGIAIPLILLAVSLLHNKGGKTHEAE